MRAASNHSFETLALELFPLQFEHNWAYRRVCLAAGLKPGAPSHWSEIPTVPTTAFKEFEFTSIPAGERTRVFCSSGTTEQRPSRHFHHARSLAIYESSVVSWAEKHLPLDGTSLLFLTPAPKEAPHSSLVHMFDVLSGHGREAAFAGALGTDGAWHVNIPAAMAWLTERATSQQPVAIMGTAFNFVHLFDALQAAADARIALPSGSWVLETGGYKGRSRAMLKSELHQLICESFSVSNEHVVTEYGMCELSSQAYDTSLCEGNVPERVLHFPPWARALVVSPETGREVADGEMGLLRVYDLANVYSVMGIETQDLARKRGANLELIGRAAASEPRGCSLMAT